jgi:hypothetical protein
MRSSAGISNLLFLVDVVTAPLGRPKRPSVRWKVPTGHGAGLLVYGADGIA